MLNDNACDCMGEEKGFTLACVIGMRCDFYA